MLKFYYNPKYKYTNRELIDVANDTNYREIDYENIDSPDTINGHIIYQLQASENIPTYVVDASSNRRYFVSGITQLRTGKYQISLIRDIMSETPMYWKNEKAYIQAGTATDFNKYKRWDLPFTNTKVGQQRLPINGKSSFFVFYVNEQHYNSNVITEDNLEIKASLAPGVYGYDYDLQNLNSIPFYEYVNAGNVNNWSEFKGGARVRCLLRDVEGGRTPVTRTWRYDLATNQSNFDGSNNPFISDTNNNILIKTYNYSVSMNENNTRTSFETAMSNFLTTKKATFSGTDISTTAVNNLNAYVDKVIKAPDPNNSSVMKLWTIRDNITNINISNQSISKSDTTSLKQALSSINWVDATMEGTEFTETGDYWLEFSASATVHNYTLEELGNALSIDFNFLATVQKLPTSAVRCVNILSNDDITDLQLAQALMMAQTNPSNETDTGRIIDIQYLPFSIAEETEYNSNIKINNISMAARFLLNDDYSFFTNLTDLTNINKETDTIKIVSPSRASQFLFRPFDNAGNMEFTTKITIKPYTSIIYVRPSTQGLLLQDWDDKDCLIIQEDFSLTKVTSSWVEYVYANKNYQNTFNRQIQGREFERSWEKRVEEAQAKADNWTARNMSSKKAQTYTGNLPIISNIAGAIGTAFQDSNYMQAAQLDREYNQALYDESLSIAKDQFSYQLDNLKSQPLIPSQITTIDVKFLDGVYLEFYSTNETERGSIAKYYEYNGNRIDAYGLFSSYYGAFIRGKIIKSDHYTQPEIDEVNRRLGLGIFTEGL